MANHMKIYLIWLSGVILWNFGFPSMSPIADVIAAIALSAGQAQLARLLGKSSKDDGAQMMFGD
jgi:hypothetical protein